MHSIKKPYFPPGEFRPSRSHFLRIIFWGVVENRKLEDGGVGTTVSDRMIMSSGEKYGVTKPKIQTSCLKLHQTEQVGIESLEGIFIITRNPYKIGLFLIQIYAFYSPSSCWNIISESCLRLLWSQKGL